MSDNSLTPTFAPFRSGCGMCKPSTDYYSQPSIIQTSGGNYCDDGLIPESTGADYYQEKNYNLKLDSKFIKDNYGIDYATAQGGKSKKSKKGGFFDTPKEEHMQEEHIINVNPLQYAKGGKKSKKHMTKYLFI